MELGVECGVDRESVPVEPGRRLVYVGFLGMMNVRSFVWWSSLMECCMRVVGGSGIVASV